MSTASDVDPEREIRRLHLLLEDWYGGIREDIEPIVDALADDFSMIRPDGTLCDRDAALAAWTDERDQFRASEPPVAVEIDELSVHRTLYGVHQLTYLKRLRIGGEWKNRRCSLWLRETERVPSGLQWLHQTETSVEVARD